MLGDSESPKRSWWLCKAAGGRLGREHSRWRVVSDGYDQEWSNNDATTVRFGRHEIET
ncbi:uncharacterized protein G2W53_003878 [Senna tora]|uniref:Uncharacterized protein n=1 Tax=Senna tora TaxID=362788 RepID=A0A834XBJ1_9FABA|nr:uncharacterized protein G2W53_003878 [Senna tora]